MMLRNTHWLWALIGLFIALPAHSAQSIQVGSYNCPPFIIESTSDDQVEYRGLSVLLWDQIAKELDIDYSLNNFELEALLQEVEASSIAVGISCISITPEREKRLDFTHSFYETHLAIAVKPIGIGGMVINLITNAKLWKILGLVALVASIVGAIYYFLEHRVNSKLYSMKSKSARGIEGFILGLLFITKGPFNYYEFQTLTGRVLTVLLAVITTFALASITALLASSLTLGALTSDINGPNDLRDKKVAAKLESTASKYLTRRGIHHTTYEDLDGLMTALDNGSVQAIVADDAVLKYTIGQANLEGLLEGISVLPYQFEKQNYGLILPEDSPLRESINQALLKVRGSEQWQASLTEYRLQ
ncbi:transporter substrate-binding domain-containing protein [Vibrio ulleungensis]|uniref:Transporter substrate-binding domain-containing protein n=1 Tax=Vibrio ulleungensis TaxID=2807619 RepID=A0ABS2HGF0_9VIBR|nr:transporter substrate-binding domain-containing protein [Vibrio ulleungensis]MBM7036620.1 transporter substrate-binding domain-containing protein [Vibrio ulleungensis]